MSRKPYGSDVTRKQYDQIKPLLENAKKKTRPRRVDLYEVFCAILYVLKSGCPWRLVPHDFPGWRLVYMYYQQWCVKPSEDEASLLERALKKSGGRRALATGTGRQDDILHY